MTDPDFPRRVGRANAWMLGWRPGKGGLTLRRLVDHGSYYHPEGTRCALCPAVGGWDQEKRDHWFRHYGSLPPEADA